MFFSTVRTTSPQDNFIIVIVSTETINVFIQFITYFLYGLHNLPTKQCYIHLITFYNYIVSI